MVTRWKGNESAYKITYVGSKELYSDCKKDYSKELAENVDQSRSQYLFNLVYVF